MYKVPVLGMCTRYLYKGTCTICAYQVLVLGTCTKYCVLILDICIRYLVLGTCTTYLLLNNITLNMTSKKCIEISWRSFERNGNSNQLRTIEIDANRKTTFGYGAECRCAYEENSQEICFGYLKTILSFLCSESSFIW